MSAVLGHMEHEQHREQLLTGISCTWNGQAYYAWQERCSASTVSGGDRFVRLILIFQEHRGASPRHAGLRLHQVGGASPRHKGLRLHKLEERLRDTRVCDFLFCQSRTGLIGLLATWNSWPRGFTTHSVLFFF